MPLFNARFLKKIISDPPAIPKEHRSILETWSMDITSNRIREVSEDQIESRFYEKIVKNIMGYSGEGANEVWNCLLYTSPSPRDATLSRMPSSA